MSNGMILDFTVTTCLRPEILRRTLESFRENLRGVEWGKCTAHVNIDPVGPGMFIDVGEVLFDFFGKTRANTPSAASFPAAVKWCFAQPTTQYCFHLEDDWALLEPIEIDQLAHILQSEQKMVVNLRAHSFRAGITRAFLSPGLWRSPVMRTIAANMNDAENPEQQIWKLTDAEKMGRYWPDRIVLRDLGREWLAASGFRKDVEVAKGVNPFVKWVPR